MKKKIALMVAFGCLGASAASANYDILGRKGSKMNSPMVYKNVDYAKTQKQEQEKVGSSLENRGLAKMGMPDNVTAIEGIFTSMNSYTGSNSNNAHYYFKRHYANSVDNCSNNRCYFNWSNYKTRQDSSFIKIKIANESNDSRYAGYTPNNVWTESDNDGYSFDFISQNGAKSQPSPYGVGGTLEYEDFDKVKGWLPISGSGADWVRQWFDNKATDVGVFLAVNARPVKLADGDNVGFILARPNDTYQASPGYETRDSRAYSLIKKTSRQHAVVYIGKDDDYGDPSKKTPQVYMGVRNNKTSKGSDIYGNTAKALDNFIYQYRTLEFVPAGNYNTDRTKPGYMNGIAYAENAITVGAIDASKQLNGNVASYSSWINYINGSTKPEIFNFSNLKTNDRARRYCLKSNNKCYDKQPLYDGTEMSASYTAGMVSHLLSIHPFYRWHPEVVKALLLTVCGNYPSSVGKIPPFYKLLTFIDDYDVSDTYGYDYESRYWNGDIRKLKTRTSGGNHEIWFVVKNRTYDVTGGSNAAISWLSSGDDIAAAGKVPQNFDMYVYGCQKQLCANKVNGGDRNLSETDVSNLGNLGNPIAKSEGKYGSYETVSIPISATSYDYLVFKVVLKSDVSQNNKNQIVLGFNYTSSEYPSWW